VCDNAVNVAERLAHIAVSTRFPEQVHIVEHGSTMEGFDFVSFLAKLTAEEKARRSKSEILESLRGEGERFAQASTRCIIARSLWPWSSCWALHRI
jgi:hypothetical protein